MPLSLSPQQILTKSLLQASVPHRKPKPSLSHAKLTNAQLPCHKLLMSSQEFICKRLLVSLVKKTKVFPKAQLPFRNTLRA
ncbi:unnamed protein product [Prunus armeniaca]